MRTLRLTLLLLLACAFGLKAQDGSVEWRLDPILGYTSDLGFQYGLSTSGNANGNSWAVNAYNSTKGQTLVQTVFQSYRVIPGLKMTAYVGLQNDPYYRFYGFNGGVKYNSAYDRNKETRAALYSFHRRQIHTSLNVTGKIDSRFSYYGGVSFWNILAENSSSKDYDTALSLYNQYVTGGLIGANEAGGGSNLEFSLGVIYDTRDRRIAPESGIWAELMFIGSPDLFPVGTSYVRMAAHMRHYVPIIKETLTFAYHLAYQGTVLGETPFYMLPNLYYTDSNVFNSEGLGGYSTVRGLLMGSLLGNGYAWANVELRYRFFEFNLWGQDGYIAINPFFDTGRITHPYKDDIFECGDTFIQTAGIGLKYAATHDMIISVEGGKVLGHAEYPWDFMLSMNYLF